MEQNHLIIDRSMRIRAVAQPNGYLQLNQPLPLKTPEDWSEALEQLDGASTLFLAFTPDIVETEGVTIGRYHDSGLEDELFWGLVDCGLTSATRERMIAHAIRKERLRIAQLLHDTICQEMLGLAFATRAIGKLTASQPERAQEEWQNLADDAGQSVERIRSLSAALNPQSVTNDRMAKLLDAMKNTTWSRPRVNISGEQGLSTSISTPQARLAYAIITELLLLWGECPETEEVSIALETTSQALEFRILADPDRSRNSPCKYPSHLLKVHLDQLEDHGGSHQPVCNEQGTMYGTITLIPKISS